MLLPCDGRIQLMLCPVLQTAQLSKAFAQPWHHSDCAPKMRGEQSCGKGGEDTLAAGYSPWMAQLSAGGWLKQISGGFLGEGLVWVNRPDTTRQHQYMGYGGKYRAASEGLERGKSRRERGESCRASACQDNWIKILTQTL